MGALRRGEYRARLMQWQCAEEGGGAMLAELLSNGEIIVLPESHRPGGIPEHVIPHVVLLAPYNRALVGTDVLGCHERWLWGKLGGSPWQEVTLYDGKGKKFSLGIFGDIYVNAHAVTMLRQELLWQLAPPGEHEAVLSLLRDALRNDAVFALVEKTHDPDLWRELVEEDESLRWAYWGFRLALAWGAPEMIMHLRTWLRLARNAFDNSLRMPRLWAFLTGSPDDASLNDLLALGFREEHLRTLYAKETTPAAVKGPGGYLTQFWYHQNVSVGDEPPLTPRIWLYLTAALWEDLRGRRGLSVREMVFASWGFLDALDASSRMGRYGKTSLFPVPLP